MRILLVEDDARISAHIVKGLGEAGHTVDTAYDGRDGLYLVAGETFDVIILDRMLPNVDGLTILRTLRAGGNRTPVLLLSALGDIDQRVDGLRAGGDDYLPKPFAMTELVARVDALARRTAPAEAGNGEQTRLLIADLELNLLTREARRAGEALDLTDREFRLLEYLMRNAGRVLTRTMILEQVWGYRFDPQTNVIDQHVSRLRQKIDRGRAAALIRTVRGSGYVLKSDG